MIDHALFSFVFINFKDGCHLNIRTALFITENLHIVISLDTVTDDAQMDLFHIFILSDRQ